MTLVFDRQLNLVEKSNELAEQFEENDLNELVNKIRKECTLTDKLYVHQTFEFNDSTKQAFQVQVSGDKSYAGFFAKVMPHTAGLPQKDLQLSLLIKKLSGIMLGHDIFSNKINQSFNTIGEAVAADRIYLFKNYFEDGSLYTSQVFEWTKGSVSKQIENPLLSRISYESFPGLKEIFDQNGELHTKVALIANQGLREVLEYQEILSILLTPIFVENRLWGFVGYDNCTNNLLWTESEVSVLKLFSVLVETVVYREQFAGGLNVLVDHFNYPAAVFDDFCDLVIANSFHAEHCKTHNCPNLRSRVTDAINDLSKTKNNDHLQFTGKIGDKEFFFEVSKVSVNSFDEYLSKNLYLLIIKPKEEEVASNAIDLELLEKNKTLEESNSQLSTFVNRIAHDLKAPVRNIRGFAKLLSKTPDDDFTKHSVAAYLNFIDAASVKLERLIDGLSAFSKAGQKQLNLNAVSIREMVDYWFNQYSIAYGLENATLKNNISHLVSGDSDLLNIAFANIVSNAVKYSSKHEHPVITATSNSHSGRVEIMIEDNGCGFDMKHYNKIFGFLERLHSDEQYSGSGIGLSTVKKIIDRHQGEIWLLSKPGEGTKVFIVLNPAD